jgi:hypothetical protein
MDEQMPQPERPFFKGFGITVLGNLLLLLAYSALLLIIENETPGGAREGIFSFGVLIASFTHAASCFIASIVLFILKRPDLGTGFLLSALVIPLIGFSFCLGGFHGNFN